MPGLASCRIKQPAPAPTEHCPYLSAHGHGWLVLLCLPPAEQTQVILVLQLGLSKAGSPGPVGIAFHHLHQSEQPGYKRYHVLSADCTVRQVLCSVLCTYYKANSRQTRDGGALYSLYEY